MALLLTLSTTAGMVRKAQTLPAGRLLPAGTMLPADTTPPSDTVLVASDTMPEG